MFVFERSLYNLHKYQDVYLAHHTQCSVSRSMLLSWWSYCVRGLVWCDCDSPAMGGLERTCGVTSPWHSARWGRGGRNFSLTFYKLLFTTQSLCSYRESSPALRGSVWWSQTPALYVAATRRVFLSDAAWPAVFWREHSMKWALKTPGWTSWLLVINNTKSKCSCE